jgi:precorrin-6Y C5,15-methyltransferase (decarboxylating) CbiT subunit
MKRVESVWPYLTPGIPDHLFERLSGISMSSREIRLLILSYLQLEEDSILWDIGAGTGTLPVEVGLLCPQARIVAIERDEEVAALTQLNCAKFGVKNVEIVTGSAPDCLSNIKQFPERVCIEGDRSYKEILQEVWKRMILGGRVVVTTSTLNGLYQISESLAGLQARHIEVVQSATRQLKLSSHHRISTEPDPVFLICGVKVT